MVSDNQAVCVQHDTFVVKQSFLQWLHKRSNPRLIVNFCFIVVLIFSTLLTWREVVVLEDAYISSQRNHLETVASALDRQLQFSVDKLLFFRHSMRDALETPLAFGVLHDAVKRFAHLLTSPSWQIAVDKQRTLPINGVSDAFVEKTTLLNRDDEYLDNELSAALEVGYLLRLASSPSRNEERVIYVSRAGFFLETDTPGNSSDIVQRYYHLVTQPWFTQQSERENRARAVRWFISPPSTFVGKKPLITASVPVYYNHVWYGVVAMDFLPLCGEGRSQHDYIELSRRFHSVLLFNVPVMIYKTEAQARRFLALVDEFYERHVKLVVSAEATLYEIYQGARLKFEYQRCVSRLQEMQSEEYLRLPHLP